MIQDTLLLDEGWQFGVEADGGSSSICPGEDEDLILIPVSALLAKLEDVDFDPEAIGLEDLDSSSSLDDGPDCVISCDGIKGCAEASFCVVAPSGEILDLPEGAIQATADEGSTQYLAMICLSHNGEDLVFETSFDLDNCDSMCLGYNLRLSVKDPIEAGGFIKKIDNCIGKAMAIQREEFRATSSDRLRRRNRLT